MVKIWTAYINNSFIGESVEEILSNCKGDLYLLKNNIYRKSISGIEKDRIIDIIIAREMVGNNEKTF